MGTRGLISFTRDWILRGRSCNNALIQSMILSRTYFEKKHSDLQITSRLVSSLQIFSYDIMIFFSNVYCRMHVQILKITLKIKDSFFFFINSITIISKNVLRKLTVRLVFLVTLFTI